MNVPTQAVLAALLLAAGCSETERALAQPEPDPTPPSDPEMIDETRTAPARGEIPGVATPRREPQPTSGVVVIVGPRAGEVEIEGEGEPPRYYYYAPPDEPIVSPLYQAAQEAAVEPPREDAPVAPRVAVRCEAEVEPIDLADRAVQLRELAEAAPDERYRARLESAAGELEQAHRRVEQKIDELEEALSRADQIHARALEQVTDAELD